MVSKLRSVFSSLLGPERPNVSTRRRKRSLDDDVSDDEDDDYVTPDLKRPKLHSHTQRQFSVENGSDQSPFVRVAEWMKQKALSFGESYFYRKPGQKRIENRHHSDVPVQKQYSFEDMYIYKPKTNGNRRHQAPSRLFVGGKKHQKKMSVVNEQDSESDSSTPPEVKHNEQEVLSRLSGGGGDARKVACTPYHAARPQSDLADLPTPSDSSHHQFEHTKHVSVKPSTKPNPIPAPQSRLNTTKPMNKIISRPPISNLPPAAPRSTISYAKVFPRSSAASHMLKHNTYTVKESIRLQQREEYQQLLQQFTTTEVTDLRRVPPVDTKKEIILQSEQQKIQRIPSTTVLGSTISIPQVTSRKVVPGGRVLAHHYTSRREIREAARQRLHAPTSDISMCVTPPNEKNSIGTPTQPDFDRSDSPIITEIHMPMRSHLSKGVGPMSSFQQNLSQSVVAKEDWIKELKEKFESSTRERIRRTQEEKIKRKIYEERRLQEMDKLEQTIRDRMFIAEQEPPVLEDVELDIAEDEVSDVEELVFLTEEMEDVIDNALIPQPGGQTLIEGFKCTLTRSNIQTLNGLNWLNDEIINFYLSLLVERSEQDNFPKVHNFNTFFYPKLLQGGQKPLRRWTKKVDIFSKHLILVPVHLGMHWCLAVIDIRKKTITYYDSMGNSNPKCLQALKQYIYDEHKDKKQAELDMSGWKLETCMDVPQQMNGSDCGMFACKYAEYICRDATITFTQEDMPYFRRRMVWEIINKKLL